MEKSSLPPGLTNGDGMADLGSSSHEGYVCYDQYRMYCVLNKQKYVVHRGHDVTGCLDHRIECGDDSHSYGGMDELDSQPAVVCHFQSSRGPEFSGEANACSAITYSDLEPQIGCTQTTHKGQGHRINILHICRLKASEILDSRGSL